MVARRNSAPGGVRGNDAETRAASAPGHSLPSFPTQGTPLPSPTTPKPRGRPSRGSPDLGRRNSAANLLTVPEENDIMDFDNPALRRVRSIEVDADASEDEEVGEWLLEQELAKEGLYRGTFTPKSWTKDGRSNGPQAPTGD